MSYAVGQALQGAIYQALLADAALAGIVGAAVYDTVPLGIVPEIYVTLGQEDVRDASDKTGHGSEHRFEVSVVGALPAFGQVKAAAAAVCDALVDQPLTLARGRLVSLTFRSARARHIERSDGRRIDLVFRARTEDG